MSPHLPILREIFGYDAFRGPQQAIIDHVAAGGDALVLMPTGGGKSLCYQIPAIARQRAGQGITVVVSPLIALMHDQVGALHEAGVSAAFLNSPLTSEEASDIERRLLRVFASPRAATLALAAIMAAAPTRRRTSSRWRAACRSVSPLAAM